MHSLASVLPDQYGIYVHRTIAWLAGRGAADCLILEPTAPIQQARGGGSI
jgi:hypothetical protein